MSTLFVADLHLDAARPQITALFERFLAGPEARHAEALYILGDLFEAWIGDDDDAELPARAAEDYLRLVGTVALAYTWCRAARVAQALDPAHPAHAQKREGARYFFDYVLPGAAHWLRLVQAARHPVAPV